MEKKFKQDYSSFLEDPFWLYNELGKKASIKDFVAVNADEIPFPEKFKEIINDIKDFAKPL